MNCCFSYEIFKEIGQIRYFIYLILLTFPNYFKYIL